MEGSSSSLTLDQLNDDCLLHIFSFLPWDDVIILERVCKRWQRISLKSRKEIKIDPSKWDLEEILKKHKNTIWKLTVEIAYRNKEIFEIISMDKYCKKLFVLKYFDWCDFEYLNVQKFPFLKNLKTLELLNFNEIYNSQTFLNKFSLFLKNTDLEEIFLLNRNKDAVIVNNVKKELHIRNNSRMERCSRHDFERLFQLFLEASKLQKGEFLKIKISYNQNFLMKNLLPISNQLESLSLCEVYSNIFCEFDFETVRFNNLRKLKCFRVHNYFDDDVIKNLVQISPNLEVISFCDCDVSNVSEDGVRHFGKLKKLTLFDFKFYDLTEAPLQYVATNCSNLEYISCLGLSNISPSIIESIVTSLPNLKLFRSSGLHRMTRRGWKFVSKLVGQRKNQLHFEFFDYQEKYNVEKLGMKERCSSSDLVESNILISVKFNHYSSVEPEYFVDFNC